MTHARIQHARAQRTHRFVRPDPAHVRALRVLDALGEFIAALVLIAGGAVLTALATLV